MTDSAKRILWVDDEIEFLRAHILFLEEHGYDVARATNGDDAIAMVKSESFDLVLLDEQMPGKDGLTTLEELKTISPTLPIVMVTKSEEERLMEAALGRNISGYLIKPVNPSQILSVCKSILHARAIRQNHVTSSYVRDYTELKANLLANPNPQKWEKVWYQFCKWDIELNNVSDSGLLATHRTHRKEAAKKFIAYVEENYVSWFGRKGGNNNLLTNSIKRKVVPVLNRGEKCALVILAGFRVDQWQAIQSLLEPFFRVENAIAWSMIPSERNICRTGLFSGQTPREVSLKQPELWSKLLNEEDKTPYERELLRQNLRVNGIDMEPPPLFHLKSHEDSEALRKQAVTLDKEKFITVVVEFFEMLSELRGQNPLMVEMVPDEKSFRDMAQNWFANSRLLEVLKDFASRGRTVILTSDHGSVLVDQPAEVFCQEEKTPNPRVKMGQDISCDERHALFIETPVMWALPGEDGQIAYAIAKENNYFVYPNKFQYFVTQFKGQMVSGGLSIDELLVPLVTLTPKK